MFWEDHLNGDLAFRTQPSIHGAYAPDSYAPIPYDLTQINLSRVSFLRLHRITESMPVGFRLEHQRCLCSSDTGNGVADDQLTGAKFPDRCFFCDLEPILFS